MCVAHQPLDFWRHHHFDVFCVYDLHQPLSYGCWYWPVGTLSFSEPTGMRSIYVIHQPLSYWCRARPVGMLCTYVFPPALELWVLTLARRHALFYFARGLCNPFLWLRACCWLVAKNHSIQLQHACAHAFRWLPVCVCACVWRCMYVCCRCSMTPSAGALRLV